MKRKIIQLSIAFIIIHSFQYCQAQQTAVKIKEFGIGFNSLTSFSIRYQWGKENTLYRLAAGDLGFTDSYAASGAWNFRANIGLTMGLIQPLRMTDKFDFVKGGIVGVALTRTEASNRRTTTYRPLIGMILGARYHITPALLLYAEISPNFYYSYTVDKTWSNYLSVASSNNEISHSAQVGINGFSTSGALLTIAYSFSK